MNDCVERISDKYIVNGGKETSMMNCGTTAKNIMRKKNYFMKHNGRLITNLLDKGMPSQSLQHVEKLQRLGSEVDEEVSLENNC